MKPDPVFSSRYEESYVLNKEAESEVESNISKLTPQIIIKEETVATTYFEPVLTTSSENSYIARFRQRLPHSKCPQILILGNSGNLEIKIRNINSRHVAKMGTFLPDEKNKNIYTLMKLVRLRGKFSKNIVDFIDTGNSNQLQGLVSITPEAILKISRFLSPFATRVNIRKTFKIPGQDGVRITIERCPVFYAYPISHLMCKQNKVLNKYDAELMERSNKLKLEIKAVSDVILEKVKKSLMKVLSKFEDRDNNLTRIPYSEMVIKSSVKRGVLIREGTWDREIEAKANILSSVDIELLMERIRNYLIEKRNLSYQVFGTEPSVKARGQDELHRTIVGWRDTDGKWHEVVTLIRLTLQGCGCYGYAGILKWKSDTRSNLGLIMDREEKKEYLKENISDEVLIQKANAFSGRNTIIAGVVKKHKYRVKIQDCNGRNFGLSLDECVVLDASRKLVQMEAEYVDTVKMSNERMTTDSVGEACVKCIDYFVKLLASFGVNAEKTSLRKIDFPAIR